MPRPTRSQNYDVPSSELRQRLADVMKDVESGATVTVTRYGKVVARIVPTEAVPGARRDPFDLSDLRSRMPQGGRSAVEMLREERDAGR